MKTNYTIYIDSDVMEQARDAAVKDKRSVSTMIEIMIEEWLKKHVETLITKP
jgi:hypothetical protein